MNILLFLDLVRQMRHAQVTYLRHKNGKDLVIKISLEMQVDKVLKAGKFNLPQERVTSITNPIADN